MSRTWEDRGGHVEGPRTGAAKACYPDCDGSGELQLQAGGRHDDPAAAADVTTCPGCEACEPDDEPIASA